MVVVVVVVIAIALPACGALTTLMLAKVDLTLLCLFNFCHSVCFWDVLFLMLHKLPFAVFEG